jgi:starvation-inducible DNA-binding protein
MLEVEKKLRGETQAQSGSQIAAKGADEISKALNAVLADLFALYVKTKNFHWHMSGAHFRDYHLLLDEQSAQVLATIDPAAERIRKLGRSTLRSVGHIARLQRVADNDAEDVTPTEMLSELRDDNSRLADALREIHELCDRHRDIATASNIENWIDEAEGRVWFLAEAVISPREQARESADAVRRPTAGRLSPSRSP